MFSCNHSVHWGINPTSKNTTPTFSPSPLLNLPSVQGPLSRQSLQYIGFSCQFSLNCFKEWTKYKHISYYRIIVLKTGQSITISLHILSNLTVIVPKAEHSLPQNKLPNITLKLIYSFHKITWKIKTTPSQLKREYHWNRGRTKFK